MNSRRLSHLLDIVYKKYPQLREAIYRAYDKRFYIAYGKMVVLLYVTGVIKVLHVNDNFHKPSGAGIVAMFSAMPGHASDVDFKRYDVSMADAILDDVIRRIEAEIAWNRRIEQLKKSKKG